MWAHTKMAGDMVIIINLGGLAAARLNIGFAYGYSNNFNL